MPNDVRVPVAGGELVGHRGGDGEPALLLHGGPAVPDHTERCAEELHGLFHVIRYTQRGVRPSLVQGPYSIEQHMADALAVLDAAGVERAWAIGHSWGGHLALHLAVAHPERLLGVICIDPLGAHGEIFAEFGENLRRPLSDEEVARIDEVEELRRHGEATEADLIERWAILWPLLFARPEDASLAPAHVGVECSTGTNASIKKHFQAGTLVKELPKAHLPALFVHGAEDPLPVRASTDTARLIPAARVEVIPDCGHFPWLEQPGAIRRAVDRLLAPAVGHARLDGGKR